MKLFLTLCLLLSTSAFAQGLEKVLGLNDALFTHLLGTDQAKVQEAARALSAEIKKQGGKLKTDHLDQISAKNAKEKNLEHYDKFLVPVVELVRSQKGPRPYNVFYCPMVKKAWVQDVSKQPKIRNVFAQEMLECGEQQTRF